MDNTNTVFESLFKTNFSDNASKDLLTETCKKYPYFSAAQFFLLQKTNPLDVAYKSQIAKTALLFNNNYWLNFQLNQSSETSTGTAVEETNSNSAAMAEQAATQDYADLIVTAIEPADVTTTEFDSGETSSIEIEEAEEFFVDDAAMTNGVAMPLNEEDQENNGATIVVDSNEPEVDIDQTSDVLITEEIDAIVPVQLTDENSVAEMSMEFLSEAASEGDPKTNESTETAEAVLEKDELIHQPIVEEVPAAELSHEEIETAEIVEMNVVASETVPELETEAAATAESNLVEPLPESAPVQMVEEAVAVEPAQHQESETPIVSQEPAFKEEAPIPLEEEKAIQLPHSQHLRTALDSTEDTLSFEPLHSTDYFASIGVKITDEVKATDKLGKQLKSFTEWLKTMKKVHNEQLSQASNDQPDNVIEKLAEQSNAQGAVVTEAMAQVLVQQGSIKKAIEVFEKLSLLNPAKSAYFAIQISKLKEN